MNKHLELTIEDKERIIVISDFHSHLDRFLSLLDQINYQPQDYLIILGDFTEKGDQVFETIHYLQDLQKNERVFVLMGNCEWFIIKSLYNPSMACHITKYLHRMSSNGCLRQAIHDLNIDIQAIDPLELQRQIRDYLKDELSFFMQLPITLKINNYLFVHAGIEKRKDYQNSSLHSLLEMQHFLDEGHILDETVIVGHLPTSNYHLHAINNDIIIDQDKRIICIDGGTGVKNISQLNALIIQNNRYTSTCIQPLIQCRIIKDISPHHHLSHKIAYPHYLVDVIKKGKDFSLCKQVHSQTILNIKNEFLYQKNHQTYCLDDYCDHFIYAKKDSLGKVIGIYGDWAYIKYHNQIGWIETQYIKITEQNELSPFFR